MFIAMDAVLAGYASGQMNAIVIEANEKGTFLVPVKDGMLHATFVSKFYIDVHIQHMT